MLFWNWTNGLGYPYLSLDSWIVQGRLLLFGDGRRVGGIQHRSQCLDYELGLEIPFGRGLRNMEGVPDCDFEHERDFGKDEAGYRGGAG